MAHAAHVAQVPSRSAVDSGFPCENNILEAQVGLTPGPASEVDRNLDMEAVALEELAHCQLVERHSKFRIGRISNVVSFGS